MDLPMIVIKLEVMSIVLPMSGVNSMSTFSCLQKCEMTCEWPPEHRTDGTTRCKYFAIGGLSSSDTCRWTRSPFRRHYCGIDHPIAKLNE